MDITYSEQIPDSGQLYALYECLGWNGYLKLSKEQLHQAIAQSWCTMNAYEGSKLVGTGRVISDGVMNAYLSGVGVRSDYQNKGIGSQIVRSLADRCRSGHLHLQLFCEDELQGYYRKHGFEMFAVGMKYIK